MPKLRHVAALALTGWYLMLPPVRSSNDLRPDTSAALGEWSIEASYDTTAECQAALKEDRDKWVRLPSKGGKFDIGSMLYMEAACIATDDPRLREPSK